MRRRESSKLIYKRISAKFKRISKQDLICILVLLSAAISTRLILILNTPFLYGQDAYLYLSQARDFASTGSIQFKEGMPFVFFLGAFVKVFGPVFGEMYASRVFMVLVSAILVLILYLLGLKMSGRLLGLGASLLANFEPYFLAWSTVPYREVLAISAGLLALYLAISDKRGQNLLSLIFFYIAIFTRSELYLALAIPLLIFYLKKALKIRSMESGKARFLAPLIFAGFLCVLPSAAIYLYVQSWGAFGLPQRVALFLTPELLSTTLESSFRFYDQQILNQVIYVAVGVILALIVLNIFVHVGFQKKANKFPISFQFSGVRRIKDAFFSHRGMTAFCLFLLSVIYIIVLTIFAYGYNWAFRVAPSDMANIDILRHAVIIVPSLSGRYLILLRLLISYPLAYPLVLVVRRVWGEIFHEE